MFAWIMDAGFRGRNHGSGETPISIQGEIFLRLRVMLGNAGFGEDKEKRRPETLSHQRFWTAPIFRETGII